MPLYEFECKNCDHTFDRILTIREMETVQLVCPKCESGDIRKLISPGGIKVGLEGYAGKIK